MFESVISLFLINHRRSLVQVSEFIENPFSEHFRVSDVDVIVVVDERRLFMIVEVAFLFSLDLLQVLFPLSFEELNDFNIDCFRIILLKELESSYAFMEIRVIDFACKDEVVVS